MSFPNTFLNQFLILHKHNVVYNIIHTLLCISEIQYFIHVYVINRLVIVIINNDITNFHTV